MKTRYSHFINLGITLGARPIDVSDFENAGQVAPAEPMLVALSYLHPHDNYSRVIGRDLVDYRLNFPSDTLTAQSTQILTLPLRVLKELIRELRAIDTEPLKPQLIRWVPRLLTLPVGRGIQYINFGEEHAVEGTDGGED